MTLRLFYTSEGFPGDPPGLKMLENDVRLPWRRRDEAHPICSPRTKRVYLPATRKYATYKMVTPSKATDDDIDEELTDEQLSEIASAYEKSNETDTVADEKPMHSQ